jgi:hypothetical protein
MALGTACISDIREGTRWAPYRGDTLKPVHCGDEITEDEATQGMEQ